MTEPVKRTRDLRLDFFRGLGMFIIYIAHMPGNWWTLWIPARFGFSDATEIFVFCSGMASAIAFGAVFDRHGWLVGTARIIYRIWQVYWAHIAMFMVIAASLTIIDGWALTEKNYIGGLNLTHFFERPGENLPGLLTLTYVPNYFDILPMYLVILAMLPIVMGLARLHPSYALIFCALVWTAVNQPWLAFIDVPVFTGLNPPAEPWTNRTWFFNPFAWQLVFFTGFAFIRGWLPAPPVDRRLIVAAVVILVVSVPFTYFRILQNSPELAQIRTAMGPLAGKTFFGLFRYIHFLALAYLAWVAAGPKGANLPSFGWQGRASDIVRMVGQQSLAVFLASMVLARWVGVVLDLAGRNAFTMLLANLFGFIVLIVVAKSVSWIKSQPWKRPAPKVPLPGTTAKIAGNEAVASARPRAPERAA